jgi:hypothetical protein
VTDPNARLNGLFDQFARSAWRWECQTDYAIDHGALNRWKQGLPRETAGKQRWLDYISKITTAGQRFDRVRMYNEPLNDYLRWMIEFTHENVAAGEDIRWIPESTARELAMPSYDFYLFDEEQLAIMRFDPVTKLLADLDVTDDPELVEQHRVFRDRVWPLAVPHADLVVAERGQ